MNTYTIRLTGKRTTKPVTGELVLTVKAETEDEALDLARDSLPGFDWSGWTTMFGVTELYGTRQVSR